MTLSGVPPVRFVCDSPQEALFARIKTTEGDQQKSTGGPYCSPIHAYGSERFHPRRFLGKRRCSNTAFRCAHIRVWKFRLLTKEYRDEV
jgi:hypothetical protein